MSGLSEIGRPKGTTKENRMLAREAKGLPRIIYQPEWEQTLARAKAMYGSWLSCWLAFCCIFGKRRNEICRLKWKDIWIEGNYLFVKFNVGKKKSRVEPISSKTYTKSKTLNHYAMPYILEYILNPEGEVYKLAKGDFIRQGFVANPESAKQYLFPALPKRFGTTNKATITVHRKFKNGKGEEVEKDYSYMVEAAKERYRRGSDVYYYVKKVNPDIWLHLGRTTVGTRAAENGASQFDIAAILDVSPRTAWAYAEHGTAKTKSWNDETS